MHISDEDRELAKALAAQGVRFIQAAAATAPHAEDIPQDVKLLLTMLGIFSAKIALLEIAVQRLQEELACERNTDELH